MPRSRGRIRSSGKPTRNDVAKLAATSGTTVSRVFSGRADIPIAAETRARILEAAKQLGYVPNAAAHALTSGRAGVVGFWMCLQYSRYRGQVLDVMREVLGSSELAMMVANVDEEYRWDQDFSRTFRASVDGIIAFDSSVSLRAFADPETGLAPRMPFVSMGAIWSEDLSYVGIDLRAGTDAAMRHLFETGRRDIGFLVPQTWCLDSTGPRAEGYREAMLAAGATPRTLLVDNAKVSAIKPMLADLIARRELPEALLCVNDDVAISVARALATLGVKPGKDVSIVGFDGIRETEEEICPISTVRQPIERMCSLALEYLERQIRDPATRVQQTVLIPDLIVRESSQSSAR